MRMLLLSYKLDGNDDSRGDTTVPKTEYELRDCKRPSVRSAGPVFGREREEERYVRLGDQGMSSRGLKK